MNNREPTEANAECDELAILIGKLTDEVAVDECPSDAEILSRYPEFADELRSLLPTLRAMACLPLSRDAAKNKVTVHGVGN